MVWNKRRRLCLLIFLLVLCLHYSNGKPEFLGGMMTFTLEDRPDGNVSAHMEVLTGWRLGTGPCGPHCSARDVRTQTHRQLVASSAANNASFGTFKVDGRELNADDRLSFNESVVSVNEQLGWEQDLMTFTLTLHSPSEREKVSYTGHNWINLTMQGADIVWNFQTTINTNNRNDTLQKNRSPKTMINPIYRIPFNQTTWINLPLVDDDGDIVRCKVPSIIEVGVLYKKTASGVFIHENCSVKIAAMSKYNYTGQDLLAVAVEVSDTNAKEISIGSHIYRPFSATFSKLQIQFTVLVEASLSTPVFVPPTPEPSHTFVIYHGATWSTSIFAESLNGRVQHFIASGTMPERLSTYQIQSDPKGRQNVVYAQISSTTPLSGTKHHIVCISAVDDTGVESAESRCFRLVVNGFFFNHSTQVSSNKPYFIHVPSENDIIECPLEETCIFPIYVKSSRDIANVAITYSTIEYTDVLMPISNTTIDAGNAYRVDISLRHSITGKYNVCIVVNDINGVQSEDICVQLKIYTPDLCASGPCLSGRCLFNDESGTLLCECKEGVTGKYCDTLLNRCDPNPCEHGHCISRLGICFCTDDGINPNDYTGRNCSERINNDCPKNNACNNNGICEDGIQNYTCHCFSGFSGKSCEIDQCRGSSSVCAIDGCHDGSCFGHGKCSKGVCYCGLGYSGNHCERKTNTSSILSVSFEDPTLTNGSMLACTKRNNLIQPCAFDVYVSTNPSIQGITLTTTSSTEIAAIINCMRLDLYHGAVEYVSRCTINETINENNGHFVCMTVSVRSSLLSNEWVDTKACFEVTLIDDIKQTIAPRSFLPSTPSSHSRIVMQANDSVTFLLYTTSGPNNTCEIIKSTSENIHLMDPNIVHGFDDSQRICMTQMITSFNQTGVSTICLIHVQEQLCLNFVVFGDNRKDPCLSQPNICQNDGVCFATEYGFKCICPPSFTGLHCERGPCNDHFCGYNGHCFVNNYTQTCVCMRGYFGRTCNLSPVTQNLNVSWPVIDRTTGIVKNVSCNRVRLCEVYVSLVYSFNDTPPIGLGYTSKEIDVKGMQVIRIDSMPGLYKINIPFIPRENGQYMLCLQTFTHNGTNMDEACFNISVTEGVDLIFARDDIPYFISPSLQPQSAVQCQTGEQCHVSYTATPGKGHELQCLTGRLSSITTVLPFEHYVFSSCTACVKNKTANTNCTFDVVFVPNQDMSENTPLCFTLGLKELQVQGETRCFKVANHFSGRMEGCRQLLCHNGGFCDSRYENNPVCICKKGYTGQSCETLINDCNKQFFATNDVIAVEVKCSTNKTCSYPYNVCGSQNEHIGYFSENLYIHILTYNFTNASTCICSHGTVQMISSTPGSYRFCIQAKSRLGLVEDEICPTVRVSNVSNEFSSDKNKPHFVLPTLPSLSTIKCTRGVTCHILVFHTEGYTSPQLCPRVKDTSIQHFEMQHIFTSERTAGVCMTDVAFLVPANQDLNERVAFCLKVSIESKQGEERCFSLQFADNILSQFEGPCKGIACYGNSLCIANLANNTADCRCQGGYTGTDCNLNVDECKSNPCSNGGTCKDMINKYQCQCANGYFGSHCQIEINCDFEKNSFCGWRNAQTGDNFDWSLYRGPTPSDGTGPSVDHTLRNSSGTYAFIETSAPRQTNQSAWLHSPLITPDGERYCLSFWYNMFGPTIGQLNVYIFGNTVTPPGKVLWSQSRDQGPSWLSAKIEINASDPFMITFEGNVGDGYEGDIALDDIALSVGPCVSLTTVSYQTTTVTRMSVSNTSPTTSPHGMHGTGCYGNPCIRGVCYVHLDEYFCLCPSGFEGLNCQIDADECSSQPCKNGGTCEDDVDNFVCHCVHGYTGQLCDTEIDECVSQPCQHGGQCVDGLNHYTCMCLDGFHGEHCQNVLDPCYDSPCMRGTCFSHLSFFVCVCPPGYSGKFCEKGQGGACDSHPCQNGATCTQNATTFMCTCPLGFEGSLCQKDIDECSSYPCRNNGICHDERGAFRCECPHGYSGLDCSNGHERKCFSCQGLGTNVTCNRVTTCKSDEVCYVESSSTSIGTHSFSVGCRRKSECINSTTNNCTHCCEKDYCNDGGCGIAGYQSRHQRGPICYDCDDMADMSFCTQVTACAYNQKCTTYGSPSTGYDGKCITQNTQCGFTGGNGFCQSCCSDDFCNYNCTDSYARTTVVMP